MKTKYVKWYAPKTNQNGSFVLDDKHKVRMELRGEAIFHQFGVDYEEFETGPGNYSTAIIELPDGTVKNIPVENIAFK